MAFEGNSKARDDDTKMPSERNFGLTFAVVFLIVGLFKWPFDGTVKWWALAVSVAFGALSFLAPQLLRPLNRVWFRIGLLLHRVVNPVVLSLMFLIAILPMALIMRAMGKKFLNLDFDSGARTYWIARDPKGPEPQSIRNQF